MKKLSLSLIAFTLISSFATQAEKTTNQKRFSFGLGFGSMYAGVGSNIALTSKTQLKYLSLGCVEYSSLRGSTCGVGAGWISTKLLDVNSNKHGIGFYLSLVDKDNNTRLSSEGSNYVYNTKNVYGAGINYTYFSNGINNPGFNIGYSIHLKNSDRNDKVGSFLQLGYQF